MALILLALPAAAQDLSSDYEQIGEILVTMDGEDMNFPVVVDLVQGSSQSFSRDGAGLNAMSVTGFLLNENGEPSSTVFSVGVVYRGTSLVMPMSAEFKEDGINSKSLAIADGELSSIVITDFVRSENNTFEFGFSGVLVRATYDESWDLTVDAEAAPIAVSGSVSVVIPAEFHSEI
jgi:hypothetical protein